MTCTDYCVLICYFLVMAGIGVWSMLQIKRQEDFFMGGRGFGKLLQVFATFGAGTGAYDPVAVGRTTFTSGLSGIWSVFLWLFVTPFYWLFAVWYRRMRHLTLGDWFVERYQSKLMGLAYAVFGVAFYIAYMALGFSAVGKVCAPLIGFDKFNLPWTAEPVSVEYVLVPVFGMVIVIYGVLGGLRAAYWTDLIQGIFIILLSVLLIPAGLDALVDKFGGPEPLGMLDGFRVMHERLPAEYFQIIGTPKGSDFPLHYIVAITLLSLVGIVVQPHLIAIGGGTAKTENTARVGLVTGTFLKRFCSVGWALTALIILALMADNVEIAEDPDRVWGVAARTILAPFELGLVGLLLACMAAALMSSADCYMLIVSALVVRNGYAAYINPRAGEKECILVGRVVGLVVLAGGVMFSLCYLNVFEQLKIVWELPIVFAAPFWLGMFWRRATKWAAWLTLAFSAGVFFIVPAVLPVVVPSLATNPRFAVTNDIVTTIVTRPAAPADVARREGAIALWDEMLAKHLEQGRDKTAAIEELGPRPQPLSPGQSIEDEFKTGGKAIYWKGGVGLLDDQGEVRPADDARHVELVEQQQRQGGKEVVVRCRHKVGLDWHGKGSFNLDFLVYDALGVELTRMSNPALETLRLPTRLILPFLVMIVLSLITPRDDKPSLDRFYVKMKTPVDPDRTTDEAELELSYRDPARWDHRRLFRFAGLEIQKPRVIDVVGFVIAGLICFSIIGFTVWVANLGSAAAVAAG